MALDTLRALLPACASRGLPMLVANPDVVTVDKELLVPMPGMLAQARTRRCALACSWSVIHHCSISLIFLWSLVAVWILVPAMRATQR